jgi:hypothetical protein
MLAAFRIMEGNPKIENSDIKAYVIDGGFVIDYSGDRCGLNPEDFFHIKKGKGYDFNCHNVDNPLQQFMLLVGLSALWKKAKEKIKAAP